MPKVEHKTVYAYERITDFPPGMGEANEASPQRSATTPTSMSFILRACELASAYPQNATYIAEALHAALVIHGYMKVGTR